jgi:hypothetical protein
MHEAQAHHSFAAFDETKSVELSGTVADFRYTNPHIWIDILVTDAAGNVEQWGIESGPPSQLRPQGWTADILKPGDKVHASLHPRKDGVKGGSLITLTLSDGTPVGNRRNFPPPRDEKNSPEQPVVQSNSIHPLLKELVPKLRFGTYRQPAVAAAKTPLPPSADPRSLAGRYFPNEATILLPGDPGRMLPYNDAGAAVFLSRANDYIAAKPRLEPLVLCKPGGAIRAMNQGFPVQVTQTSEQINFIFMEDHLVRRIHLKPVQPQQIEPSTMGQSFGHWEGNALHVETTGFRDGGWMDEYGDPSSAKLHLSEVITKRADGSLQDDLTLEDPTYYTGPTSFRRTWQWSPNSIWDEVICEENNHDAPPVDPAGSKP